MKPPTSEEKIKMYQDAINYIKGNNHYGGLCSLLLRVQSHPREWSAGSAHFGKDSMKHNFPEIHKQKPANKKFNQYWWPITFEGMTKRISVLEAAIKTLKSK